MELITTKPKTQIDTNNDTNKLKEVIEVRNEKKFIAEPTKITFTTSVIDLPLCLCFSPLGIKTPSPFL